VPAFTIIFALSININGCWFKIKTGYRVVVAITRSC
jgi:hypothetical protein